MDTDNCVDKLCQRLRKIKIKRNVDELVQKMRRIKIRKIESYDQLVIRYNLTDKATNEYTQQDRENEVDIVEQNLAVLEKYPEDPNDFILFNYAKALHMKNNILLDENHPDYLNEFTYIMRVKIRIIRQKIDTNIRQLIHPKVSIEKKLFYIKKLNLAIMSFLEDVSFLETKTI